MNNIRLVFVDLETTGLSPEKDDVLQIGSIILNAELQEYSRFEILIKPVKTKFEEQTFAAHLTSGLYRRCETEGISPELAFNRLHVFFKRWLSYDDTIFLAGNSVHFDRSFIPKDIDIFKRFHYRHLDMSVFKVLAELGMVKKFEPETPGKHTVIADLEYSIAHLKFVRDQYFLPTDLPE